MKKAHSPSEALEAHEKFVEYKVSKEIDNINNHLAANYDGGAILVNVGCKKEYFPRLEKNLLEAGWSEVTIEKYNDWHILQITLTP